MDTQNKKIKFGTDGWRGLIADDFTFDNVKSVAWAIGVYLQKNAIQGGVVIGYDARFLASSFANTVGDVLNAMGIETYKFNRPMPTPIVAYTIKELKAAGAVMLTASHNPYDYQGIKFIAGYGGPADSTITSAIEAEISKNVINEGPLNKAGPKMLSSIEGYWRHISQIVDFARIKSASLKIAVNPLYGAGVRLLSKKVDELSESMIVVNDSFDPLFGGQNPDPNESNLQAMAADLKAAGFDLGIALDGDGDRFGIVDSLGIYLSPNQVISLLAYYLLTERKLSGALVRTVATTQLIDDIARDLGAELIETPVGFKWICREMLKQPVVIGGEESGGLSILGHIPEKDGILATLLMAEMLAATDKKPLSESLNDLYEKYGRRYGIRLDIHLPIEKKLRLMTGLKNDPPTTVGGVKVARVSTIDGVKLVLANDDWLLIRPSGTEPLVRAYIEAKSPTGFSLLEKYTQSIVK